jgi:hypothetical protein
MEKPKSKKRADKQARPRKPQAASTERMEARWRTNLKQYLALEATHD